MSALALWCRFAGWQGGTLADAERAFKDLPMAQKDRFCGVLVENLRTVTDPHVVAWFMRERSAACGLIVGAL